MFNFYGGKDILNNVVNVLCLFSLQFCNKIEADNHKNKQNNMFPTKRSCDYFNNIGNQYINLLDRIK